MKKSVQKKCILSVLFLFMILEIMIPYNITTSQLRVRLIEKNLTKIEKEIGNISNLTLEEVYNNHQNEKIENLNLLNQKNKVIINKMSSKKTKENYLSDSKKLDKKLSNEKNIHQSMIAIKSMTTANPFKEDDLSNKLLIVADINEKQITELKKSIKSLGDSSKEETLAISATKIEKQNTLFLEANNEMKKYVKKGELAIIPNAAQFQTINEKVNLVENPTLKKPMMDDIAMIDQFLYKNHEGKKLVALTFDDGPNDTSTLEVLDVLKKQDVKATFFVLGRMVEQHPEVLKQIVDEGHEVGNHSYDHQDFMKLTDEEIISQIKRTNDSIHDISGKEVELFRPPYGAYDERVEELVDATFVLWHVDSLDWKTRNSKKILTKVKQEVQPNTIILMHDIQEASAEALDKMITDLKKEGYTFCFAKELVGYL